jgi:hypothetical protein
LSFPTFAFANVPLLIVAVNVSVKYPVPIVTADDGFVNPVADVLPLYALVYPLGDNVTFRFVIATVEPEFEVPVKYPVAVYVI